MAKIHDTNTKCWQKHGATSTHSLLVTMQNDTVTLKDSLIVSYKGKHALTLQSSNHVLWYLPK